MRLCNVCLTHVAWGTTASWSSTGRRSSPKRMLSSQKVCVALSCSSLFPSTSSCSPLVIASWLCTPAFSQLLSGLWDKNEGDMAVNPRQFYNLFKEAVPYFSGYRWERRDSFYFLISYSMLHMPCKMKTAFWGRYITVSSSDMNKRVCISVNAVNRMHRSSSGSYWISCIQKSTAGLLFADHWRNLNKNMPDSGVWNRFYPLNIDLLKGPISSPFSHLYFFILDSSREASHD